MSGQRGEKHQASLGSAIRSIREERRWSLAKMAAATGLSASSLSKLENAQRSLTYDKLVHLAEALEVDISRLFSNGAETDAASSGASAFAGRRSVHRREDGFRVDAGVYTYRYLAHELRHKRFTPVLMEIHARSPGEFEDLIRHAGDEFTFVIEGEIEVHTDIYTPLRLKAGESVFFDSGVGHAYVKIGVGTARILCIGTDGESKDSDGIIPFAARALELAAGTAE